MSVEEKKSMSIDSLILILGVFVKTLIAIVFLGFCGIIFLVLKSGKKLEVEGERGKVIGGGLG